MIVTVKKGYEPSLVRRRLADLGLWVKALHSSDAGAAFQVEAYSAPIRPSYLEDLEGVEAVFGARPASAQVGDQNLPVRAGQHLIGPGAPFAVVAGPCSIDTEERIHDLARRLARRGARFLRGGAYKPRTSPYSFQGHGAQALRWMREAAANAGLAVVTECMSERSVDEVAEFADLVQVGSRNMQNYALLKEIGRTGKPVLLKRGMASTVEEWILAGEYLMVHGGSGVVFCERGVRSFDTTTRNLLDLGVVADLVHARGFPVVVDPSHATGRPDLIAPLCRAARALGAHGVMFETHGDRGGALSDGPQALLPDDAESLVQELTGGCS
ncbi:MAG: 3-deoxy-7-phosphoheptulonate synthase [Myxococcota bacterium]